MSVSSERGAETLGAHGRAVDSLPYKALEPLPKADFRRVYLETIFTEIKWDPQCGDVGTMANFGLLLEPQAWQEISQLAEQLAAEALAAETELLQRPELHQELGLPFVVRWLWRRPGRVQMGDPRDVRLIRFDFHYTPQGWRISEANCDTPGGWIEASGFSIQMLKHYSGLQLTGNPVEALANAIRERLSPGEMVGLIHATAYMEDRAMMITLQRRLEDVGLCGCLISPAQLRWQQGQACFCTNWEQGRAAYLVRYFPAEWLADLPLASQWPRYFNQCRVPSSNPATALLVQSKRFPLVWDRLSTPLPTWRKLLPTTYDLRHVQEPQGPDWVLKPVFGRAGEGIAMKGVTTEKAWRKHYRQARREAGYWIAQRRFETLPVRSGDQDWYPCIGVYTVAGRAAGIYGRVSLTALTDETAKDIPVFIAR